MRAAALRVEIHIPEAGSLKEKRAVLRPVLEGLRRLGSFSVAEVAYQDTWQRSAVGVAVVTRDGRSLDAAIGAVRRYLDGCPGIEVLDVALTELEAPE